MWANKWPLVPISELYEGLYDGPHATPKPATAGPVFLGIKNVTDDGRLDLADSEIRHIAEEDFAAWTRRVEPRPGDLVFTYEATLNRYAIIPIGFRGCLGRRMALIRTDGRRVNARYLHHYFFTPEWRTLIKRHTLSGATVDRIPLNRFPEFPVRVPPLPVQERIAGILSRYDDLIENCERRIRSLDEMARALYREWFVLFRYPGFEKSPQVESPRGMIPKGWRWEPLSGVASVNAKQVDARHAPNLIHYIDISSVGPGVVENVVDYAFTDAPGRARRVVSHGDILWSCVRPNRRSHALVLHPDEATIGSTGFAVLTAERVPCVYLYSATTTDSFVSYLEKRATGAAYPAVTARVFEEAPLLVPDKSVLERFGAMAGPAAEAVAQLRRRMANLRKTRDLLLPRLLSGELSVDSAA